MAHPTKAQGAATATPGRRARIQSRQFAAASLRADDTGDNAAVRDYLGPSEADPEILAAPLVPTPGASEVPDEDA